mmetsp:Transcript_22700/g.86007  ORF Transcript_22700/g.86007 Transcript_22700/m.86007 type:complete len:204 (+) Transcript_22700:769-1380(+)
MGTPATGPLRALLSSMQTRRHPLGHAVAPELRRRQVFVKVLPGRMMPRSPQRMLLAMSSVRYGQSPADEVVAGRGAVPAAASEAAAGDAGVMLTPTGRRWCAVGSEMEARMAFLSSSSSRSLAVRRGASQVAGVLASGAASAVTGSASAKAWDMALGTPSRPWCSCRVTEIAAGMSVGWRTLMNTWPLSESRQRRCSHTAQRS